MGRGCMWKSQFESVLRSCRHSIRHGISCRGGLEWANIYFQIVGVQWMRIRLVDGGTAQLPLAVWPELFLRKVVVADNRSQAREDGDAACTTRCCD